jgi:hypothetical protein
MQLPVHLRSALIDLIVPSSVRYFQLPFQTFSLPAVIEALSWLSEP